MRSSSLSNNDAYAEKPSCCVRFLRNWILWTLIAIAILGIVLSVIFALRPCKEKDTYTMADIDAILVVDNSGSIDSTEWTQEIEGLIVFLNTSLNDFTGNSFRVGMVNFATEAKLTYSLADNTGEQLLAKLPSWKTHKESGIGYTTETGQALNLAREEFNAHSNAGQFRLAILVTDGAADSESEALIQSGYLKDNATLAGILVGSSFAANELYSVTSCTPASNRQVQQLNNSCTYFLQATDFNDLNNKAHLLAKSLTIPQKKNSTCVAPIYFLFLFLLLPLLLYLFAAPVAFYLRKKFCPPKEPGMVMLPPAASAPVDAPVDGKWAPVQAGGYLWRMDGKATGAVPVRWGDGAAPPSAPGAELRPQDQEMTLTSVYGGGTTQVTLSRYLCCCVWWCCLSKEEQGMLGEKPSDYEALDG